MSVLKVDTLLNSVVEVGVVSFVELVLLPPTYVLEVEVFTSGKLVLLPPSSELKAVPLFVKFVAEVEVLIAVVIVTFSN